MTSLIEYAEQVMAGHGWSTRSEASLAEAGLELDLVAENDAAIVFFEELSAGAIRDRAAALSAGVASVTLQAGSGVKAWEAYLVLLVTGEFSEAEDEAQLLERDLNYCRKVVIDGSAVADGPDPGRLWKSC